MWHYQNPKDNDNNPNDVDIRGNGFGFNVGKYGSVYATTDSGHTWRPVTSITNAELHSIYYDDIGFAILVAYIAGSGGFVAKSTDMGNTFNPSTHFGFRISDL